MAKVEVYTTPICPYCVALKEFLKENKVEFEEIDVSQDEMAAKEMIEKTGQMGVPVLEICLLYTSPSPRDLSTSRMPSSA